MIFSSSEAFALKWSLVAEILPRIVQPVSFIFLALILTPIDFGYFTYYSIIIAFCGSFIDIAIAKTYVQDKGKHNYYYSAACTFAVVVGGVIASLLFCLSNSISVHLVGSDALRWTVIIMACHVLLTAITSPPLARMQKALKFRELFYVRIATSAIPAVISVWCAWVYGGHLSMVVGVFFGQVLVVIILFGPFRENLKFTHVYDDLSQFGRPYCWILTSGIFSWFYVWGDALFIGMAFKEEQLGIYRTGNQISILSFSILFSGLMPVVYSMMSKFGHCTDEIIKIFLPTAKTMFSIAIPIALFAFMFADILTVAVFPERWQGLGAVLSLMSGCHAISWLNTLGVEALRANGKENFEAILVGVPIPLYLAVYYLSTPFGLQSFMVGRLFCTIVISGGLGWILLYRAFGKPVFDILFTVPQTIVYSSPIVLAYFLTQQNVLHVYAAVVIAALWVLTMCVIATKRSGLLRFGVER